MMRIVPNSYEIDVALQLTVEDDFSYFCKFEDLAGVIVNPNTELPAIADSCYIDRAKVFSDSMN